MEHLGTLDAGFLEVEDSDRHVSLAMGGLSVIEGAMPDYESLLSGLGQRIMSVPRFRQLLRTHPLDLGAPEWVDDANIDLSHHIRRAALPHPGADEQLFRFVADVMERRLDRDRPLWECWLIEGLTADRWAILMKMHHCMADGIASTHLLAALSDESDGDTFASEIRAARDSRDGGLALPGFTPNPLTWIGGAWCASRAVTTAAVRAARGAIELAGDLLRPAAPSSLIGPRQRDAALQCHASCD
jgi:diacylglycerol O-acyltransferase